MSDLEPIRSIIPRVLDQAAQSAEDRDLVARIHAIPTPAPDADPDPICEWVNHEPHPPWPPQLHSRLIQIREAVQAMDLDDAITMLFDLAGDVDRIERAEEHVALRHQPDPS
jgi:hypothetical protein